MKIHTAAVDIKSSKKIISIKLTNEHIHDCKMLPRLVDDIAKSKENIAVGKVFVADGAYDSNAVFRCLTDRQWMCHVLK